VLAQFLVALVTSNLPAATVPEPDWVPEVMERWDGLMEMPDVVVRRCGVNGMYYPGAHVIVLCQETFTQPELARWIFSHELAHAFIFSHDLALAESEFAADELGSLLAEPDEITAAARWFFSMRGYEHDPDDPHPAALDRAAAILCLLDGSEAEGTRMCRAYYRSALENWTRIYAQL
jgi:hypothetical protein